MRLTKSDIERIYSAELSGLVQCRHCSTVKLSGVKSCPVYHVPPVCNFKLPKWGRTTDNRFGLIFGKSKRDVMVRFRLLDGMVVEYNGNDEQLTEYKTAVQLIMESEK